MNARRVMFVIVVTFGTVLAQFSTPANAVTYSPMSCSNGYYAELNGPTYLDMYPASSGDYGLCAPPGIFSSRNGYTPSWGYETNVANDYGSIPVYPSGGCSSSPDTGWAWDFQLPCKAHDYCYDLRKAGFSGTVTDSDCDSAFYWLMEAHCNDRVFSGDCRLVRDSFYSAVSLPWVVTNPDPAPVAIRPLHSGKCADIPGSSISILVPITQFTCYYTANQKFFFMPASGNPGYFEIRPSHYTLNCAALNGDNLVQWGCGGLSTALFRIQGSYLQNNFTIRSKYNNNSKCWDVPYSSLADGVGLMEYWCNETTNQRFLIG